MNPTDAIHAVLDQLVSVWGRGDGTAYGALFTEDASYVTYVGATTHCSAAFSRAPSSPARSPTSGSSARTPPWSSAAAIPTRRSHRRLRKVQAYTFVRDDGGWRIAAFQNTLHKSLMEAISVRFLPASKPRS